LRPNRLADGAVHLWWINLDTGLADTSALSMPELERARGFRTERGRARYVVAHAAVREILAHYADTDAASLSIVSQPHGKPCLAATPAGPTVPAFSLSRSGDWAVLAVTQDSEIGVDLEIDGSVPDRAAMLAALTPNERDAAAMLDDDALTSAFRVAWTRKEACLKAAGIGFAVDPSEVEVSLDGAPCSIRVPSAPGASLVYGSLPVHVVTLAPNQGRTVSLARVGVPITTAQVVQFDMSRYHSLPSRHKTNPINKSGAFKCAESLQS